MVCTNVKLVHYILPIKSNFLIGDLKAKLVNRSNWLSRLIPKRPFKYHVSLFLAFLGPTTYVSINSTVKKAKIAIF